MQYRSPVQQTAILNLTPLIDIVFLLLVFFMLTAHFVEEQVVDLALPTADTGDDLIAQQAHKITLTPSGAMFLDGEPIHANVLSHRLAALMQTKDTLVLQLAADKETPFEHIVQVLDVARALHIDNLEILTEQP